MARAKVEQHPATGTTLVVMVGLSIAFLLFIAFLNVVKTGNILSEANLLYAALVFYAGAGALYLGFGITGTDSYVKFASLSTWAGLIANTGAVAHRWYEAGHPPFASIYEMLLSFVWTLAALTLIAEKRYGVKVIGTVTMPVAIVGVVLMELLPSEVRPLVPALQSTWLHVHVTLAMLAYAACALSFALAMMFLIQDKMKTESFLVATSVFTVGIYGAVRDAFREIGRTQCGRVGHRKQDGGFYLARRPVVRHDSRPRMADAAGLRRCGDAPGALCARANEKERGISRHREPGRLRQHSAASAGIDLFPAARPRMADIPRSMPRVSTRRAWLQVHLFSPRWSAASSPTCFTCCCCGGVKIWSACFPTPTRSTASPTKLSALLSRCSP